MLYDIVSLIVMSYNKISRNMTSLLLTVEGAMVFNTTFNNISVISWWSDLLVDETGVPAENHQPAASQWQTLSHNVVFGIRTHNHHTIMTTTAPQE